VRGNTTTCPMCRGEAKRTGASEVDLVLQLRQLFVCQFCDWSGWLPGEELDNMRALGGVSPEFRVGDRVRVNEHYGLQPGIYVVMETGLRVDPETHGLRMSALISLERVGVDAVTISVEYLDHVDDAVTRLGRLS